MGKSNNFRRVLGSSLVTGVALSIITIQMGCGGPDVPLPTSSVHATEERVIRVGETLVPNPKSQLSVTLLEISEDRALFRVSDLTTGEMKEGWLHVGQPFSSFAYPEMGPRAAELLRIDPEKGKAVVEFGRPIPSEGGIPPSER